MFYDAPKSAATTARPYAENGRVGSGDDNWGRNGTVAGLADQAAPLFALDPPAADERMPAPAAPPAVAPLDAKSESKAEPEAATTAPFPKVTDFSQLQNLIQEEAKNQKGVKVKLSNELSLVISQAQEVPEDELILRQRERGVAIGAGPAHAIASGKGGLLSLSLALEIPHGSQSKQFHYAGNREASAGVGLDVQWQDVAGGDANRLALVSVIALLAWLGIRLSRQWRGVIAALGITVPLGLVSIAPAQWHPILDGIFLGSVVALSLWALRGWVRKVRTIWDIVTVSDINRVARTASGFLLAALIWQHVVSNEALAQPAPNAPAAQPPVVPPVRPTRSIIVPYVDAKNPQKAEQVLLSRELFIELWNQAHPADRISLPAGLKGLASAARYDCDVTQTKGLDGATANVTATIIAHSFSDEQVVVPLSIGAIAINSAKLDGEPATLRIRKQGNQTLLDVVLLKAGSHQLELNFSVAAQQDGGVGQFTLPLLPIPIGEVVFKLPQKDLVARVNGSTSAYRRIEKEGAAYVTIPVAEAQPLTIAWRPQQEQAAVGAIVNVDSQTSVVVDDTGLKHFSKLRFAVPQGSLADVAFDLPKSLFVRRVTGAYLAGWELKDVEGGGATGRRLRVFFNPPIKDATELNFELFQDVHVGDEAAAVNVTTLQPLDITRENGLVVLHSSDDFSFRAPQATGARQVEVNATRYAGISEPARLGFAYTSRPMNLSLQIVRQAGEAISKSQHVMKVGRRRVLVASRMDLDLKRVARPSVSLKLSDTYRVNDVNATSMSDWYITPSDGTNPRTLTIEFKQPVSGNVQVVLQGYTLKGPQDLVAEMLFPQPLEVSKQTTSVGVWFDAGYNATPTSTTGWKTISSNQLPPELQAKQATPAPFAFSTDAPDVPMLGFDVVSAQLRLTADAVVIASVTDTSLDYSIAMKWRITGASADTFMFTTPASLKDRLIVKGAGIRDVTSTAVGERLRWTVTLWDAIADEYFALATATLPPQTKKFEIPDVRFEAETVDDTGSPTGFAELDPQRLYAMLVNLSDYQLRSLYDESVETVAIEDVPLVVKKEFANQAADILRIRDRAKLPAWEPRKLDQQAGAPASVNLADLTFVLAPDSTWRGQAVYTLRNRRRQFLAVRMPEEARLLSVFVKDLPARTVATKVGEKPVQLIPLPKSNESDLSFQVKLVYAGQLKQALPRGVFPLTSELDLPAPDVVSQQESATLGIPVARTLWHVHLPKGLEASLIEDSSRSNVSTVLSDEAQAILARNVLQDAEQMLNVLDLSSSIDSYQQSNNNLKQVGVALDNFKQLNQSLSRYESFGRQPNPNESLSESTAQREFAAENYRLQQKLGKNRAKIEALQQQADQQRQGQLNPYQNGANNPSSVNAQPDASRYVLDFNNDSLFLGNSANGLQQFGLMISEDLNRNGRLDAGEDINGNGVLDMTLAPSAVKAQDVDGAVRFELELKEAPQSTMPAKPADGEKPQSKSDVTKESGKPSDSPRTEGENGELRRNARSQLRMLNSDLDNRQQISQQPGAAQPQFAAPNNAPQQDGEFKKKVAEFEKGGPDSVVGAVQGVVGPQAGFVSGRPVVPPGAAITGSGPFPPPARAPQGGGFGGMGGGFGGMGGVNFGDGIANNLAAEGLAAVQPVAPPAWTQVGGLSLPITIPTTDNKLSFSKVGGAPKLALKLQSNEVLKTGFGLLWTLLWLGVGATFTVMLLRTRPGASLQKPISWLLVSVGLTTYFILPAPGQGLAFAAFVVGLLMLAARSVRKSAVAR